MRQQNEAQPIFINHGDINININLPNETLENKNIQEFILNNI